MKTSPFGPALAFLAALLVSVVLAPPALAHDALRSSDPAKDAKVENVRKVTLEFTAKVRLPTVVVTAADGTRHESGKPSADGAVVTQQLDRPLPAGKYTIAYRIVSSDGHPVEGEIPFTVVGGAEPSEAASAEPQPSEPEPSESAAAPSAPPTALSATPTPVAAEQDDDGGGVPVWLWIVVGALAGIGLGMFFSMRGKRR
ncbi:copper resistance CopC family protein [Streptosporangium soli]|nr:copper resistance protein CopC [Streptosporangium sp. KLBMP 9127]